MFTGIVETVGILSNCAPQGGELLISVKLENLIQDVKIGDSISVSGVCLTVVNIKDNDLSFDVSAETLSCTQFGALTQGDMVNIEPAMHGSERIGGHLITGHVDTLGKVVDSKNIDGSLRMTFRCHHSFAGLVAKKGSICLDGVSLTVNEVSDGFKYFDFEVNCIPHTLRVTTLSNLTIGDHVHIEFDQIARYIDRLIRLKEK
tara:strand:+ start:6449 stop:7057 length:609 start_codon:yes stop_codon:yes gene_type:complete